LTEFLSLILKNQVTLHSFPQYRINIQILRSRTCHGALIPMIS